MNNFLKISLTVFSLLIATQAFSQSLIVKAGLNFANMQAKDDDFNFAKENDFGFNTGFHVGAVTEIPITDNVSFEPGILIQKKGYRRSDENGDRKVTNNLNLFYVDIPLNMKVTNEIQDGLSVFGTAGVYFGAGVTGKAKTKVKDGDDKDTSTDDIEWGSDESEDDLKRLDYGVTVGAGVETANVIVGIGFDLGLANLANFTDNGFAYRHRVLRLSVGFRVGDQ